MTEFFRSSADIWEIFSMAWITCTSISNSAIHWWGKMIFYKKKLLRLTQSVSWHIFRIKNCLRIAFSTIFPPQPSSCYRAPSFFCENETRHGLTLHYRTRRKGFVYYTMGQIRQVRKYLKHEHGPSRSVYFS